MNALGRYLRACARDMGISMAELARRAGKSRQTVHAISTSDGRLPELATLIDLALVIGKHPLQLIHLVFDDCKFPLKLDAGFRQRGDKSIFLADVTVPDGEVVLAGATFTKTWEVQNVGTMAWEGRVLQCMDDEIVVSSVHGDGLNITHRLRPAADRIDVPFTPPGGVVRMTVDFKAPALPGTCISYWKSTFADGRLCFPDAVGLTCKVRVLSMSSTGVDSRTEAAAEDLP